MQLLPVILLVTQVAGVLSAVPGDLVTNLPGLSSQPMFKHYSGYLKATGTKQLHYWFVEAQTSPSKAPVVLWMNGGPGCSSMDGMLTEHGPFTVADEGKAINMNPYSWNLVANMLYLEAPAGVGYSYSLDRNYTTDDDQVSLDNYMALKYFFSQYPEYSSNEFFITGESYGGIYVPTLAARVVEDKSFNFKGFAVGNGFSDATMNDNSLIYFGYFHGLWGKSLWDRLVTHCCVAGNISNCNFAHSKDSNCRNAVGDAGSIISELNIYNIYAECLSDSSVDSNNVTVLHSTDIMLGGSPLFPSKPMNVYAAVASGRRVTVSPPCIDSKPSTVYMNREDVKKALHIAQNLPQWQICSAEVGALYKRLYNTMKPQYLKVLSTGEHRILVYNGDVDMACNFLMDEWFTDSLGLEVIEENRPWKYQAEDGTTQVGGYMKQFKNLMFTTVRGAGHMVPTNKPIPALDMFSAFLHMQRLP